MKRFSVPDIGNYYGGLELAENDEKYYWCIENYDTDLGNIRHYQEIPESLYRELIKFSQISIPL